MSQLSINISLADITNLNKGRKRPIKFVEDADRQRKFLRNCGLEYTSRNGTFRDEKALTDGTKKCGRRCTKPGCNLLDQDKIAICTDFWKVHGENYDRQSNILLGMIDWSVPAERTVNIEESRRKASYTYHLKRSNGSKIVCCYRTFLDTYSVTKRRVEYIQKKLISGITQIEDQRGLHENRPHRNSIEIINLIQEHIHSFPTYISHYRRAQGDPLRQYLQPDLNASKMFRLFTQLYGDGMENFENLYKNILRKTKLSFGRIKSDTCSICDRLHTRLANYPRHEIDAIQQTEEELELHHISGEEGYAELKRDANKGKLDPSFVVICIDLQQILLSPRLSHGEMYYQRKMASYNFAITNPSHDESVMYFWNEFDGNRGQNDIGTAILHYVRHNFEILAPGQVRTFTVWSDRCCGQNHNYSNVCMLKYLMHEGYFTEVNQKFLVTGHTFLACDRHFAIIERAQKNETIHTPNDWIKIIRESRVNRPFGVVQLQFQDFLDISSLSLLIPRPPTFRVTGYHWIQMRGSHPSLIMTKASHDVGNPWVCHTVYSPFCGGIRFAHRRHWEASWIENIQLSRAYDAEIEMSAEKIEDIRSMMEYLPTEKQAFYAPWL